MRKHNFRQLALLAAAIVGSATFEPQQAAGRSREPGQPMVIPPTANYAGKTYGEWAVSYWQWAMAIPATVSPLLDSTGEFADIGQSGHVWFLGGSVGDSAQRAFAVPAGRAIFMPIHQWIFGAAVFDCDPSNPGVACDVEALRAAAAGAVEGVQVMQVTLDGRPVHDLQRYRIRSPGTFSVQLPEDNLVGMPAGPYAPHVADGYWLMLAPLSAGQHTLWVRVVNPAFGIDYSLTYQISVAGPSSSH